MWLLLLMIIIMPFEKSPYLLISENLLGVIPRFTLIKAVGLLGFVWASLEMLRGQAPRDLVRSRQLKAFYAFLFLAVFAGLASGTNLTSAASLLAVCGLLLVVIIAVRTERDLVTVLAVSSIMGALIFPYAVRQMIRFGSRLGVGLNEPNYVALMFVMLVPAAVAFARHSRGWRRWAWFVAGAVLTVQVILTGSRGGFAALVVALGIAGLRVVRKGTKGLVAVAVVLVCLLAVVPNTLNRRLAASGLDESERDSAIEASNEARVAALRAGLRMIAAHPFVGVGAGNFKAVMALHGDAAFIAHNTYLEIAAEMGIPALIAFLSVMVISLSSLSRSARQARLSGCRRLGDLAIAQQAGLTGYLVGGLFLSAQYENFLWLGVFLSVSTARVAARLARRAAAADAMHDADNSGRP